MWFCITVNTEETEPADEDSDQEELHRFIAEIEEAADKEWEEEESGRIRYWNREEFAGRNRGPYGGDSSHGFRRNERDTRNQRRSNDSDDSDQLDSEDDDEIPKRFDRPRSNTRRQGQGQDFVRRSHDPRPRVRSDEDVLSDLDNTMWDSGDEEDAAPANYISSSDEDEDENKTKQPRSSNNNSKTKSGKQRDEDWDSD